MWFHHADSQFQVAFNISSDTYNNHTSPQLSSSCQSFSNSVSINRKLAGQAFQQNLQALTSVAA